MSTSGASRNNLTLQIDGQQTSVEQDMEVWQQNLLSRDVSIRALAASRESFRTQITDRKFDFNQLLELPGFSEALLKEFIGIHQQIGSQVSPEILKARIPEKEKRKQYRTFLKVIHEVSKIQTESSSPNADLSISPPQTPISPLESKKIKKTHRLSVDVQADDKVKKPRRSEIAAKHKSVGYNTDQMVDLFRLTQQLNAQLLQDHPQVQPFGIDEVSAFEKNKERFTLIADTLRKLPQPVPEKSQLPAELEQRLVLATANLTLETKKNQDPANELMPAREIRFNDLNSDNTFAPPQNQDQQPKDKRKRSLSFNPFRKNGDY